MQARQIVIDDPYEEFKREEMILRDWLALDRTVLANKRTFLAYGRTSIALFALGIAFVKLIHHEFFEVSGFILMSTRPPSPHIALVRNSRYALARCDNSRRGQRHGDVYRLADR
jgi:hypothetical protein